MNEVLLLCIVVSIVIVVNWVLRKNTNPIFFYIRLVAAACLLAMFWFSDPRNYPLAVFMTSIITISVYRAYINYAKQRKKDAEI